MGKRKQEQHLEVQRVLAAAVVSPDFQSLLLTDPEKALREGYQGEAFLLNEKERSVLTGAAKSSESLHELGTKLIRAFSTDSGISENERERFRG